MLETERTFVSLLREEDLPAMMEMAREPDTFKYIKKLHIMTEAEYTRFLQVKLEQIHDKTGFNWAVWLKGPPPASLAGATGKPSRTCIGDLNLNHLAGTPWMQIGCPL